jgi:ribonuclease P protein component
MLPKKNRLKNERDFKKVYRQGKPVFFESLAVRFVANNFPHTRIDFSVSKTLQKQLNETEQRIYA